MIDLYAYTSANCWKAAIMLEETGLPYTVNLVDLFAGDQRTPEYLAMFPVGKVPAIVDYDADDFKVYGSTAILLYLAEKTGKLWPKDGKERTETFEWLMFATTDYGMGFINWTHYELRSVQRVEYVIDEMHEFVKRMCKVADERLQDREYLVGDYSIADIAAFSFVSRQLEHEELVEAYPNLKRWRDSIEAREAVQRGLKVPVLTDDALKSEAAAYTRFAGPVAA